MSMRWPVLVLLLVSADIRAVEFPIEVFEYVENARVVAFIDESDLDASARWHPFEAPPTLGIEGVTVAIRNYIESEQDLSGAAVTEIELRQVPLREKDWHYIVKLKTEDDQGTRFHYLVVLMNGKIIPAIREPEPLK
jgi:hypothetical protein